MNTKYYSKAQKTGKLLFLIGAVVSLSCCTSSNKVASSFSKRKYVKGHFSDPVVQQKTENTPSYSATTITSVAKTQKAVTVQPATFAKTTKAEVKTNFNTTAKTASSKNTPIKFNGISITKNAISSGINNNVSLKQASSIQDYVGYGNGGAHNGGGRTRSYLVTCLICLAICIILNLLAGPLALPVLGTISWIFGIAAVIFFILWIFSLSM